MSYSRRSVSLDERGDYLDQITEIDTRGIAREESFYGCLAELLQKCLKQLGKPDPAITVIPRKTNDCLLDFQISRGSRVVGYIEAKRPGTNLDRAEGSEQLERYRRTFPNLILTDFRQFRLYRYSERVARAAVSDGEGLLSLLGLFFDFESPPVADAAALAEALARRTRVLEQRIEALLSDGGPEAADLASFYRAFCDHLIQGLSIRDFADLYAQTFTYSVLAARSRAPADVPFERLSLARFIAVANGILRDAFQLLSLGTTPREVTWIVDDIVDLIAVAPVAEILRRTDSGRRGADPILHFYETFLRVYDRDLRRRRGVYYTPQPLVSYVVRSVDYLLKERLGRREGLADPQVTLLDPAAGTGTFVLEAMRRAVDNARERAGPAAVAPLLSHLLEDFYAFELMMAPYAMGHLKMSHFLEALGRPLGEGERFQLFLTNALERTEHQQKALPGWLSLSKEAAQARRLKEETPMTVVLGNPPWAGHSENKGRLMTRLIREGYRSADGRWVAGYDRLDGEPLKERNPKWLQDDYVKFFRFAQRTIDRSREGIVALVTNHGFLDNPTFRGMRQSLLASFDEVYVLDLHGDGKKKERAPDGSPDANVFSEVRQGVAVTLLVKGPDLAKRVFRHDRWGSRGDKLRWLADHSLETTEWRELMPRGPAFLFHPRDESLERDYQRGIPLPEIFPAHAVGIVTGHDELVLDLDQATLERRIHALRSTEAEELREVRRPLLADFRWRDNFSQILYRPFNRRFIFYADYLIERPRRKLMCHLLAGRNLALVVPRQCQEEPGALVTDLLVGHKAVSAYDINSVFPLYLQPQGPLHNGRTENVGPELLERLESLYRHPPSGERLLSYVYAVLYARSFRRRFATLLRAEYPRIPFPHDLSHFENLSFLGEELIDLHLLRSPRLKESPACFEGEGEVRIGEARQVLRGYRAAEKRIVLNQTGHSVCGIAPEVWSYRIGGYQVLAKWLADRAGRLMSWAEITEFRSIVQAIALTLRVEDRVEEASAAVVMGS